MVKKQMKNVALALILVAASTIGLNAAQKGDNAMTKMADGSYVVNKTTLANDVKGYRHAWADPDTEAQTQAAGKAFTEQLKALGKVYYETLEKKGEKAALKALAAAKKKAAKAKKK